MKLKKQTPNTCRFAAPESIRHWRKLIMPSLFAGLLVLNASAQLTNNFTDGGDIVTPDQYPGSAGGGWASGWVLVPGSGATLTASVITNPPTGTPLNGGGNYLAWTNSGTAASAIRRPYNTADALDITQPYVVEFDYRLDFFGNFTTFNNNNDYISISQSGVGSGTGSDIQGRTAFWVKAQGAANTSQPGLAPLRWSFYDGAIQGTSETAGLFVNSTNIGFTTNAVYHFKFQVDPLNKVYEATVSSNGLVSFNTFAATGRKLGWRNFSQSDSDFTNTSMLTFHSRGNTTGENPGQSVDNIVVYQVPRDLWPIKFTQINPIKAQTFYPASSNLVININTLGTTNSLPASGTQLLLNGVDVSAGLTFDGSDTSSNRNVTFSGLADNRFYEATMISKDQAGRATSFSFFFDTFNTNKVITIETENFNFDPTLTACSGLQTDTSHTDRYIQNWLYGGASALDPSGATNINDTYFGRPFTQGVDLSDPSPIAASNFRTCAGGTGIRNSPSDEYERPYIEAMGIAENINDRIQDGEWYNYTHEWPATNYLVYLRASGRSPDFIFKLDRVTSDYTLPAQTTTNLGVFMLTNSPPRREILKHYLLTTPSGQPRVLALNGKDTLRLTVTTTNTVASANDYSYLNFMVFVPVPSAALPIVLENTARSGSDFSFSFNTVQDAAYTVQYKTDINSATWLHLKNVIGTGSPEVVHDTVAGATRYYRVVTPTP